MSSFFGHALACAQNAGCAHRGCQKHGQLVMHFMVAIALCGFVCCCCCCLYDFLCVCVFCSEIMSKFCASLQPLADDACASVNVCTEYTRTQFTPLYARKWCGHITRTHLALALIDMCACVHTANTWRFALTLYAARCARTCFLCRAGVSCARCFWLSGCNYPRVK